MTKLSHIDNQKKKKKKKLSHTADHLNHQLLRAQKLGFLLKREEDESFFLDRQMLVFVSGRNRTHDLFLPPFSFYHQVNLITPKKMQLN